MAFENSQDFDLSLASTSPISSNEIDTLLAEILSDPSVCSLLESPPSVPPSQQSGLCLSPSAQQLEQEALASVGQVSQQRSQHPVAVDRPLYPVSDTPSPSTPSPTTTTDNQTFFLPTHHHPPTSLPLHSHHYTPHPITPHALTPHPLPPQPPSSLVNCEVAISSRTLDTYLRGQRGFLTSLSQGIAHVYLYSLCQECQVPYSSIEFVSPVIGDYVQVVSGAAQGTVGLLVDGDRQISYIQIFGGQCLQVVTRSIAKMHVQLNGSAATSCPSPAPPPPPPHSPLTPLPSPTSPTLMSPLSSSIFSSSSYSSSSSSSSASATPLPNHHHTLQPLPMHSVYPYNMAQVCRSARLPRVRQPSLPFPRLESSAMRENRLHHNASNIRVSDDLTPQQMAYLRNQSTRTHSRTDSNMKRQIETLLHLASKRSFVKSQPLPVELVRPTQDILEEIKTRTSAEYDFGSSGDGEEVSSSCIQVSLTCPLSHKRMTVPCRGLQCKHPQCFDGEAYVEFNKCALLQPREKGRGGGHGRQAGKQLTLKCPLCAKHTPFSQLYVDSVMLEVIQGTEEEEIEFDKAGSWKPVIKKSVQQDVIDLTSDDS